MSQTIRVSKYTKLLLMKLAARLQERYGRRVDLDEAIRYLLSSREKNSDMLREFLGSVPGVSAEELYEERRADEERERRKYGV
ncbi:MAG: VapB-type antitoxin [Candidatus Methanodesulfokora sp.]